MLQDSPLSFYLYFDIIFHVLTGFFSTLKGMIKTASENIKAASDILWKFWGGF